MNASLARSALTLVLIAWLAAGAGAQSAARFAPAESGVYIEVNDLTALRKQWQSDPLATYLRQNVPALFSKEVPAWAAARDALGMTDEQVIDKYFGRTVALVFPRAGDGEPGMVISRVGAADVAAAQKKLGFVSIGRLDQFELYRSSDKQAYVAAGEGWVIVADADYRDVVGAMLKGEKPSLADDAHFKQWTGKLPTERMATAYVRDGDAGHTHALGATRSGRDLTLHYVGEAPEFNAVFRQLRSAEALDFGPLPASTLVAVASNALDHNLPSNPKLDRLFSPKTFNKDVLPTLETPLLAFLGEVQDHAIKPNPGLNVPVLGIAVKVGESDAAADLSTALEKAMIIANFAAANWDAPEITLRTEAHRGTSFRVAEVGKTLAARMQRDELAAMNLCWGRIGDFFVICTQDQFFRQCIDAESGDGTLLTQSEAFKAMPLSKHDTPFLTVMARPDALSAHARTWLTHWRNVRPHVIDAAAADDPQSPEARLVKGIAIVAGLLEHYQSITIQLHRDGDAIAGRADVIRRK